MRISWQMALAWLYGAILVGVGLALVIPGAKLIGLGGSVYYVLAGLATIAAGVLVALGSRRGGAVFGAMVLATILWALWEVGLDGWALMPRVLAPLVLGLPFVAAELVRAYGGRRAGLIGAAATGLVVIAAGVAVWSATTLPRPQATAHAIIEAPEAARDWRHYGNTQGATRHSPLAQITPRNVGHLKLAWSTHIPQDLNGLFSTRFSGTPLKIGDSVYMCTALNDIVALDAETGRVRWRFDAKTDGTNIPAGNCRGVAYYHVPEASGVCAERIYTATVDARLIAIDARTGAPCAEFGAAGAVDLTKDVGQTIRGYYLVTSPPQVVRGKVVVNSFVADGQSTGEPSGVIRAFNAVTGQFAWAWDLGNPGVHTAPPPGKTYTLGTPNSWAPMSADETLGLVFVPTGNATPDYFGAFRTKEMEEYTASLVAIDAETGEPRWHFQVVHHDVWDYDVSGQPTLIELPAKDGVVPAVVQPTKNGEIFVLDRRTGAPIFPVMERPVPQGPVEGEWLSPTQPHSAVEDSIGPNLTERDMWGATPLDQLQCRILFRQARYEGPFTPMGLKPTIVHPGFSGGIEWGSSSYDSERNLLVFVANSIVNYNRLMPLAEVEARKLKPSTDPRTIKWSHVPQSGTPYGAETVPFMSPIGSPCQRPPFSRLNAIDLSTGKKIWSRPLGTARGIGPFGWQSKLPFTIGTPAFGGAITTASGLTFVAASLDHAIRAFDTATGNLLWQADLPADGLATPMTYAAPNGRQFVVIAVGDGTGGMKASADRGKKPESGGGTILAFALPDAP